MEPFGSINLDTGSEDIAVRVTGLANCTNHVYGLACLEAMWTKASLGENTVPGNHCFLDQTEWFTMNSLERPQFDNKVKKAHATKIAEFYELDYHSVRYFLFREPGYKRRASTEAVTQLREIFEREECLMWAVHTGPVREVRRMLRLQQDWAQSSPILLSGEKLSVDDMLTQAFCDEVGDNSIWRADMDPWRCNIAALDGKGRLRPAQTALYTPKGQDLLLIVRNLKHCFDNLQTISITYHIGVRVIFRIAAAAVKEWVEKHEDEEEDVAQFMAVAFLMAEIHRVRRLSLPCIPGATGKWKMMMGWSGNRE
jgi:hypothetical protein